jgi:hypothetical protein
MPGTYCSAIDGWLTAGRAALSDSTVFCPVKYVAMHVKIEVDVLSLCWDGPGALERNETPRAAGALFYTPFTS